MKQTTLDLNGPILSFTTHPQNVLVNNAGIATFVGIATATFLTQIPANPATGTGDISYRWYAEGIGALSDGINTTIEATLSGTATTTLTVTSPTTSGIQFFVSADYIPSAYQSSSPVTSGTGRSTGNAINDILFSNYAILTVNPTISISRQPSSSTVAQGQTATFSVTAASSNNTNVQYQWYIGGFPVGNGTYGAGWMDGNTISGATTNTLTVTTSSKTSVGTLNVYVSVSHPSAGNSPVTSNTVFFGVVTSRAIINFESLGSSSTAILNSINLETSTYTHINEYSPVQGYTSPGIYFDLSTFSGNVSVTFSTSEESGIFHYINIPEIKNFPENNGTETFTLSGGTVYGPCSSPNGGLYIGVETPIGGSNVLLVEEGGDDYNDMILSTNLGSFTRLSSDPSTTQATSSDSILGFYALERDIDLELEIFASKGLDSGGYSGGQGGYSKIRFTARQNEEYVITPLPQVNQGGGVFIYRRATLIASVGSGGNAGSGGNGGPGGGINVGGGSGYGRGAGNGGELISINYSNLLLGRGLLSVGIFGSNTGQEPYAGTGDTKASAPNGGRVLPCTRGKYWRDLGYSACQDLGNIQFFTDTGVRVTNTATIYRGHKPGYDIRQTSGRGLGGGGNGGQGATGGQGGSDGGGGGGGSGYTDGSVTVVSTQQGGSTGIAKVIFRTF